jgi:hypothetical protein
VPSTTGITQDQRCPLPKQSIRVISRSKPSHVGLFTQLLTNDQEYGDSLSRPYLLKQYRLGS